jgi:hypothetical protein
MNLKTQILTFLYDCFIAKQKICQLLMQISYLTASKASLGYAFGNYYNMFQSMGKKIRVKKQLS